MKISSCSLWRKLFVYTQYANLKARGGGAAWNDATNHENEINAKIRTQSNVFLVEIKVIFCLAGIFFVSEGLESKSKFEKNMIEIIILVQSLDSKFS